MTKSTQPTPTETAELTVEERQAEGARQLAHRHTVSPTAGPSPTLIDLLDSLEECLEGAYRSMDLGGQEELALTYAGEWLLDNYYIVQRAQRQIREDLPERYYRQLPKLESGDLAGYPRVYALARALTRANTAALDGETIEEFVVAYQEVTALTMGELWAVPIMLRFTLLQAMAHSFARLMEEPTVDTHLPPLDWQEQVEEDTVVANAIRTLRMINNENWKEFFERTSVVNAALNRDPAGVYPHMEFQTRDSYRGVVEDLALASDRDEVEVAEVAIELAKSPPDAYARYSTLRTSHVGFYLVGGGRRHLEKQVGYRPPALEALQAWVLDHPTPVYLGSIGFSSALFLVGLVAFVVARGGSPLQAALTALVALIPAVTVAVPLVNWLVTLTVPPHTLPKMDFEEAGIPEDHRTMVVIPALITSVEEIESLLHQLELHYLRNPDPHLTFALLTDFADAPRHTMPEDGILVARARAGIEELNHRYRKGERRPFYLFHRERRWNPKENVWMGWERKRGKLEEFNHLLLGREDVTYTEAVGDLSVLRLIQYVITLDADTVLPKDSARRLVATLAHPLNHAEFEGTGQRVIAGYTVLQPRVEIVLSSANRTPFSRIYSGDRGIDLYTRAVSDVYQDLFEEGVYVGKGIYDIYAFDRSLHRRVPEDALLSHDLFEGVHGRAALVTDVILYEEYPPQYLAHMRRLHRWVRGDWQLLPWLWPTVPQRNGEGLENDLSAVDLWKILDNLRRSLVTPTLLLMMLLGWLWLPGAPWLWTLLGILPLGVPFLTVLLTQLVDALQTHDDPHAPLSLRDDFLRWLLNVAFIPYRAQLMVDAIVTTLVRLFISHRRLLQWTTSAHTVRVLGRRSEIAAIWGDMGSGPLLTLGIMLIIAVANSRAFPAAAPLLAAWLVSPYIATLISRPSEEEKEELGEEELRELRTLARRTWLFFEHFVGPEDHWLPPDHFQEEPRGLAAHRTSPTNIGLMILSTLAAYDSGYLTLLDLVLRFRATFATLDELEQFRGHFLNWYETRNLTPLPPRYVSTVDSGNLAGSLIAFSQGCRELRHTPVLRWATFQGILDTLGVLKENLTGLPRDLEPPLRYVEEMERHVLRVKERPERWGTALRQIVHVGKDELSRRLTTWVEGHGQSLDLETLREVRVWMERFQRQLDSAHQEVTLFMPWLPILGRPLVESPSESLPEELQELWQELRAGFPVSPTLDEVPVVCRNAEKRVQHMLEVAEGAFSGREEEGRRCLRHLQELQEALVSARVNADNLRFSLGDLSRQADDYVDAMKFDFLWDPQRKVFHIGYNVDSGRLDNSYYDLLASEARLASFIAVANDDVPQSHWLHMNRPIAQADGLRVLMSWSGTMFEYLMPLLVMHDYPNTLLGQGCRAAVECQMGYAEQFEVPWGISESGYYRFDNARNYQYQAFGVPALGFKRGLGDDLVVTPYASLIALPLRPREVLENVAHLREEGLLAHYGFYEAVDYTPTHLPAGQERALVKSYMAHHQGMILLALTNFLHDDVMVERFHSNPRVQSVELLLREQAPQESSIQRIQEEHRTERGEEERVSYGPWTVPVKTPLPMVHTLSNGTLTTVITNSGSGFLQWKEEHVTRWRADTTRDNWGTWIYVEEPETDELWSVGHQPLPTSPEDQEVIFSPHMAEIRRHQHEITTHLEVCVSPEDDVEVRRLTLINHAPCPRRLRLTSYGEVVLGPHAMDLRHPAFSKLFVESAYVEELNGLLFHRRPRSGEEEPYYAMHVLLLPPDGGERTGAHEGDRKAFLGRGRTIHAPEALTAEGRWLAGHTGHTLDPIMALGQEVALEPHGSTEIAFVTLVGESREEALTLAERYQPWPTVERAFDRARTQLDRELHRLDFQPGELQQIQALLSPLLYPHPALRADPGTLVANVKGQPGLWPFGISGDYPILLVEVTNEGDLPLLREVLRAHAYWRQRGLKIDLVIYNKRKSGYEQELQGYVNRLINRMDSSGWLNQRGGIFTLRSGQMSEEEGILLHTVARAILRGDGGPLERQLRPLYEEAAPLPLFTPTRPAGYVEAEPTPLPRPEELRFDNGLGGFTDDGESYAIYLEPGTWTPQPWINVVANPDFGFFVSEAGGGYSWAVNSGENRLTAWRNDPVTDMPGEALYLRDEESGTVWSPTPQPRPADAPYLVRHERGQTTFRHHSRGLEQQVRTFVPTDAPLKVVQLQLKNRWDRPRRITVTYYVEWVLGTNHEMTQLTVIPEYDAEQDAVLARNPYNTEFAGRVAFLASAAPMHSFTTDRTEFLGHRGTLRAPTALDRIGLANTLRPGSDPCGALQVHVNLSPGETKEVTFLVGQGQDREETRALINRFRDPQVVEEARQEAVAFWRELLDAVTVETPDPAMDVVLNGWLLYQALSCRIWGRSALYQSSGAYGYRDQLQDVMSLVYAQPEVARRHLLRAARHQFERGDVLHWWHPPSGRGIRSTCSDDMLWLPFVTAHYVAATGDTDVLWEELSFVHGAPLEPEEEERYGHYPVSDEEATLFEHCLRAIDEGTTAGRHGLPLIGSGDWNDGMNKVGNEGRGESVWLGWFLHATLTRFADLCDSVGREEQAAAHRARAENLQGALRREAWDGEWYLRAFYDDGTPLGSHESEECKIDVIAQAWAVLSGAGDPERARRAMESAYEWLVRREDELFLLFTPPFDRSLHNPGYIKGYPPGIRENGGQYTHAATWGVWAFAELGRGELAAELFDMLNPVTHGDTPEKIQNYQVEPYVVAADIYSVPPHVGHGGWTWYTGSSGWLYRLGLEGVLGLRRVGGDGLRLEPHVPGEWEEYAITYRHGSARYRIRVENPRGVEGGVKEVYLDGERLEGDLIPLQDDGGEHQVRVVLGTQINADTENQR